MRRAAASADASWRRYATIFSSDGRSRLMITPLGFLHGEESGRWGRAIRLKYAERYILGDIRAQDFNSLKSTYFKQGEWNTGYSIGLDLWPVIDRRKSRK